MDMFLQRTTQHRLNVPFDVRQNNHRFCIVDRRCDGHLTEEVPCANFNGIMAEYSVSQHHRCVECEVRIAGIFGNFQILITRYSYGVSHKGLCRHPLYRIDHQFYELWSYGSKGSLVSEVHLKRHNIVFRNER